MVLASWLLSVMVFSLLAMLASFLVVVDCGLTSSNPLK